MKLVVKFLVIIIVCSAILSGLGFADEGDLDPTFGVGGKVTTDFLGEDEQGNGIVVQPDQKILVVGYVRHSPRNHDFGLARYNPNGDLDTSFGIGGKVIAELGTFSAAMKASLQADEKIVVCGSASDGIKGYFAVARYESNGTIDDDFGDSGYVLTDFGTNSSNALGLAIQSDQKIVVGGVASSANSADFAVVRYNSDGSLDQTFGVEGKVTTDFGSTYDVAYSLGIQTDNKIVLAGSAYNGQDHDFTLARYNTDGSLDLTFGNGGKVITRFSPFFDVWRDVYIQGDGKIIVGGHTFNGVDEDFVVARYDIDGSLDDSFGANGLTVIDFDGNNDSALALVVHTNAKIIMGGMTQGPQSSLEFGIAVLTSEGVLYPSVGDNGKIITDFDTGADWLNGISVQDDGKIVAAGPERL